MDTFWWILLGGIVMSCIALVGSVTLILPERMFQKVILPLVAMAAGSLLGGALFHLMPAAVEEMGNGLAPWVWCMVGFGGFFVLEQFLHWHHCHKPTSQHKEPLGWLILIADGVHNFIGGLAVAGAFMVDIRLGMVAWVAAAAHEIPQELGDFGILIHGGFPKKLALLFNLLSGLSFLVGGLVAWGLSSQVDVSFLIPLGAGNFLYIAAADLIPEINREKSAKRATVHFLAFTAGVLLLLFIAAFVPHSHGTSGHVHVPGEVHDHAAHEHDHGTDEHIHDHGAHEDHEGHDHHGHEH